MVRLIKKDNGNFTNTSNQLIRDESLTWKARGIFNYLWSQANEWQFYVSEVAQHSKDGERALKSGLLELEEHGYLKRVNRHSKTGNFDGLDWILDDMGELNRQAQNAVDGKMSENQPKKVQNASGAKRVQRKTRPTQNSRLRNNNNKNYQIKEITNKRKNGSAKAEPKSIHKEVIDYLNSKAGVHYKHNANATKRVIDARLKEGYTLADFIAVIDKKVAEWINNPEMSKYLRPTTLFGPKFESYLNQKSVNPMQYQKYGTKRVEKGTDWSKRQASTETNVSSDDLKNFFRNFEEKHNGGT